MDLLENCNEGKDTKFHVPSPCSIALESKKGSASHRFDQDNAESNRSLLHERSTQLFMFLGLATRAFIIDTNTHDSRSSRHIRIREIQAYKISSAC